MLKLTNGQPEALLIVLFHGTVALVGFFLFGPEQEWGRGFEKVFLFRRWPRIISYFAFLYYYYFFRCLRIMTGMERGSWWLTGIIGYKFFSVFLVFCKFSLYIFSVYSCGQGHDLRVLRYLCVHIIILVFVALTWSRQAQWLNVIGQYLAKDRPNFKRYFKKLTITRVHMIFTRRSFLFSTISMTSWKNED